MKSFRLELSEEEAEQLNALAIDHGNKFKPFAEYLLRLQIGTVKPPTVQPLEILIQSKPTKEQPQETKTIPKKTPIRTGEPTEAHKKGLFLQRKHLPQGITSNGNCLRVTTKNGFKYAYFKEDLEKYI